MENIFDEIDACGDLDEVKDINNRLGDTYYVNNFWNFRKKALESTTPLEKKKALTKCRYINHIYASYIPVTYGCQRFRSPHGFRGIAISSRAKIGKGCTIFQNVTIGSNTLADSKSSGFPVIGDNVYIGAGATIIGNVKIGNNVRIGAGCCVTRDVEDNCTVAQGKPIVIQKRHRQENTFLTPSQYLKKRAQITNVFGGGTVLSGAEERRYKQAFRILFAGDLILLEDQVKRGYRGGVYDFYDMFEYTKDTIRQANCSISVMEGPFGGTRKLYSQSNYGDGTRLYVNYPDEFADAIKWAGFDVVTTANNHVLDMGVEGAKRTIETLKQKGIEYTGSYLDEEDKKRNRVKILEKDSLKIALLSYTHAINGYSIDNLLSGELSYVTSVLVGQKNPKYEQMKKMVEDDFALAKSFHPDLIVVLPHWGKQFTDEPNEYQRIWREIFLSLGADVILGSHTHSVQPVIMEKVNGKNTLTAYCPGNYANVYREHNGDATALVEVYIDPQEKEVISGAVIPMWVSAPIYGGYRAIPIYDIVTNPHLGKSFTTYDLERVEQVHRHITRVMLGEEMGLDRVQERYFLNAGGFLRSYAKPLPLEESMKSGIVYDLLVHADNVCFVGDSITEGTRNGGVPWYEPIKYLVRGKVFNVSRGGATTKTLLQPEFLNVLAKSDASLFVIAIGTNDVRYRKPKSCAMTPKEYIENLSKIRNEITKNHPNASFIFIAPWTSTDGDKISALNFQDKRKMNAIYTEALREWTKRNKDVFVDANGYIEQHLNQIPRSRYLVDWIHPNARDGVRMYSKAFLLGCST